MINKSDDMSPESWKYAHRIWVTELGGCPRKRQYRVQDWEDQLPAHYHLVRGKVSHQITDQILKGEEIDPDFSDMPEAEAEIMLDLDERIENARKWKETTEIDLSDAKFEQSIEFPLKGEYKLVGKIDCITPKYIIDFKSGKKANRKNYRTQLVAYNEMKKAVDRTDRDVLNVFFGGNEPVQFNPFKSSRCSYDATWKRLEKNLDKVIGYTEKTLKGFTVPVDISFLCIYCRWRHKCRGI